MNETNLLLEEFLAHLRDERGASPHTLRNYASDLRQFSLFLSSSTAESCPLEQVTKTELRAWLGHLHGTSEPSSIARKLAALRSFYGFLVRTKTIDSNPALQVATPKQRRRLPEQAPVTVLIPALDELSRLLPYGDRDQTIIELCYAAGLRTAELTNLDIGDFNSVNRTLSIRDGVHLKRILPITKHATQTIQRYLRAESKRAERALLPRTPIFCNDKGERLSATSVRRIVKRHIQLNPRILRHSYAGHMLSNGMDPRHLQILLGHTSARRTGKYADTLRTPAYNCPKSPSLSSQ